MHGPPQHHASPTKDNHRDPANARVDTLGWCACRGEAWGGFGVEMERDTGRHSTMAQAHRSDGDADVQQSFC